MDPGPAAPPGDSGRRRRGGAARVRPAVGSRHAASARIPSSQWRLLPLARHFRCRRRANGGGPERGTVAVPGGRLFAPRCAAEPHAAATRPAYWRAGGTFRRRFSTPSSWVPARPGWARPSTPLPRDCARWCSTTSGRAARRAPVPGSKTTPDFPRVSPGRELALRTYIQALKFGATFSAPHSIAEIRCIENGLHEVRTADGIVVKTKTVIIATGVSYRTLGVHGLDNLRGAGIYYAATQVEAIALPGPAGPHHRGGKFRRPGRDVPVQILGEREPRRPRPGLEEKHVDLPRRAGRIQPAHRYPAPHGTARRGRNFLSRKGAFGGHRDRPNLTAKKAAALLFSSAPRPAPIFWATRF